MAVECTLRLVLLLQIPVSRHIPAIVVLQFALLIVAPAVVLYSSGVDWGFLSAGSPVPALAMGIVMFVLGLVLLVSSVRLIMRWGNGTFSPWIPTGRLVVRGPYRFVRNPMHSGVFLVLVAEGLVFGSTVLLLVGLAFVLVHMLYIPIVEERDLFRRFGPEYDRYCENVPRWIPRLTPWEAPPNA
jgi:protein-S-isoprenylcysteine O-methyltransferase Ste14